MPSSTGVYTLPDWKQGNLGFCIGVLELWCMFSISELKISFVNNAFSISDAQFFPGCSGPREDATRIGSAGVIRRQAVDISPLRRVNQAIYLLTTGARESAFRNIKTIAECLADELINAAKGSSNRYALVFLFCVCVAAVC